MRETWVLPLVGKIPWGRERLPTPAFLGVPCDSAGEESACCERDLGSVPSWEGPLGKGKVTDSSIHICRLPWWLSRSRIGPQCGRRGFDSWVRKIWRREWQSTPVFLPGEFHGYSPWDCKESDMTEQLTHSLSNIREEFKAGPAYKKSVSRGKSYSHYIDKKSTWKDIRHHLLKKYKSNVQGGNVNDNSY